MSEKEKTGGNGQERSEIQARLDKDEDPQDLARQYLDDDGKYRIDKWLKGDLELDDAQVQKLIAKLPILDYGRRRKGIAKKLGDISLGMVDQVRRGPAGETPEDTGQGTAVIFEDPEPWPEEIDGAVLLDDLRATFKKYIVLPDGAAEALSLWTAFTYVHDKFQISPLLSITSPDKQCGKTTLLSVLGQLVLKPLPASNVTASTIFRGIEHFHPTLLVDEADTFMKENEELRGVLNSGHLRSQARCLRCVGEEFEVKSFSTWCPKAISKIGKLWATLDDRSIEICMQRKTPDEKVERLRLDRPNLVFGELRRKLARWAQDISVLDLAAIEVDDAGLFSNDRRADNWRPLLTIANVASWGAADWVERAIEAAGKLSTDSPEEGWGGLLLIDLKELFEQQAKKDFISSSFIVEKLGELEHRPWPEYRKGKPITTCQLARLIKKYGVVPRTKRIDGKTPRGYLLSELEPLFIRYTAREGSLSPDIPLQGETVKQKGANLQREKELEVFHPDSVFYPEGVQGKTRNKGKTEKNNVNSLSQKDLFSGVSLFHPVGGDSGNEELLHQLQTHGFALVHSEIFDEDIFVTAGEHWPEGPKSPGHVVYTFDEMAMFEGESPERMRKLHTIKKAFDGQIVQ
ncbi:hypothetical protein ES707_12526 [subsurface metagenome]